MTQFTHTVQHRVTRRYNPDWSHLDQWEYLPWKFRILSRHLIDDQEDEYGGFVIYDRIIVSADLTPNEVYDGMRDNYEEGCSCAHDCCGHVFGGLRDVLRPRNRKKREWILIAGYSRNF